MKLFIFMLSDKVYIFSA